MNIKISKEQHQRLCAVSYIEYPFGSRLFGTHTDESDYDYIRVYNYDEVFDIKSYHPNIHSFQYDDVENNSQYIWMTKEQFYGCMYSGDGTMQTDILMFSGKFTYEKALNVCRTYKVIKAYCGVAKRDVKLHNTDKKRFHAQRSIYIASCLIKGELPKLDYIRNIPNNLLSRNTLIKLADETRKEANQMYMDGKLNNYYVPKTDDDLLNLMIGANNIKEFKYD